MIGKKLIVTWSLFVLMLSTIHSSEGCFSRFNVSKTQASPALRAFVAQLRNALGIKDDGSVGGDVGISQTDIDNYRRMYKNQTARAVADSDGNANTKYIA
ncbi:hypothetical protein BOX15_Mlig031605g1 [Macrostomum lignano]|uniref:Uncharacterized protein n=1 Tax=Macrostomum lignano TaxID=282301 RepID=A0A267GY90_9PLAT|nr:hypothetical protein BOX15_Mlig031605g1 [Macrostomum lignano]